MHGSRCDLYSSGVNAKSIGHIYTRTSSLTDSRVKIVKGVTNGQLREISRRCKRTGDTIECGYSWPETIPFYERICICYHLLLHLRRDLGGVESDLMIYQNLLYFSLGGKGERGEV